MVSKPGSSHSPRELFTSTDLKFILKKAMLEDLGSPPPTPHTPHPWLHTLATQPGAPDAPQCPTHSASMLDGRAHGLQSLTLQLQILQVQSSVPQISKGRPDAILM